MADDMKVANVYAKALVEAVGADTTLVLKELSTIEMGIQGVPEFYHPTISAPEKKEMVEKITKDIRVRNFLWLLIDNHHLTVLPLIMKKAQELDEHRRNTIRVRVTSAHALNAATVTRLTDEIKKATGHEVILTQIIDAAIIGGLIVQSGDTVLDDSLSGRLQSLRRNLLEGNLRGNPEDN